MHQERSLSRARSASYILVSADNRHTCMCRFSKQGKKCDNKEEIVRQAASYLRLPSTYYKFNFDSLQHSLQWPISNVLEIVGHKWQVASFGNKLSWQKRIKFLSKLFKLPSIRLLQKWMACFDVKRWRVWSINENKHLVIFSFRLFLPKLMN